jgi:hypothetical protein
LTTAGTVILISEGGEVLHFDEEDAVVAYHHRPEPAFSIIDPFSLAVRVVFLVFLAGFLV